MIMDCGLHVAFESPTNGAVQGFGNATSVMPLVVPMGRSFGITEVRARDERLGRTESTSPDFPFGGETFSL